MNQCEYCEDQTSSNPQRTNDDMHDDPKKDDRSETGRCCVEVILCLPPFLCAVSNDTQQTLVLTKRTLVHSAMLCEACQYYAL